MDKSVYIAKTKKIQIVSSIVIIGFVIAIFYHYFMSAYLGHKQFFYRSFLYDSAISFGDFWGNVDCVRTLSPYSRIGVERICSFPYYSVYYPFGQLIYYPFTFFFNKYLSLIVFFVIFFAGWYLFIIKNFSQNNKIDNIRDIFIISCASYPLIITVDRANLEAYVFLLVAVFCFFYNSNKKKQVLLASIFLSLAIAIKPFPVLFLLLLVKEKKWKNILFIIISTTIITSASALCFQEGLWGSFVGLTRNQSEFIKAVLLRDLGPDHGHSLLGLLKKISYPFLRFSHIEMKDILIFWNPLLYHLSLILSIILILFVVSYILLKERCFWKIVALNSFFNAFDSSWIL